MRFRIVLSLLLVMLASACRKAEPPSSPTMGKAQAKPELSAQAPMKKAWKEFISKEHLFSVSLPTDPKTLSQDNQYKFGKVTIKAYTSNPRTNVDWRVAVHNYPEPFASQVKPEKLIELMRDGMAANVRAKPKMVKGLNLDGNPGQEFVVQTTDPLTGKPLMMKVRLLKVGGRVYQLTVTAPLNDEALGEEASRFFDSFRLLSNK